MSTNETFTPSFRLNESSDENKFHVNTEILKRICSQARMKLSAIHEICIISLTWMKGEYIHERFTRKN